MAKIIVELPESLVEDFLGNMSDGGGEYGMMEHFSCQDGNEQRFLDFQYKNNGIQVFIKDRETGEILEGPNA